MGNIKFCDFLRWLNGVNVENFGAKAISKIVASSDVPFTITFSDKNLKKSGKQTCAWNLCKSCSCRTRCNCKWPACGLKKSLFKKFSFGLKSLLIRGKKGLSDDVVFNYWSNLSCYWRYNKLLDSIWYKSLWTQKQAMWKYWLWFALWIVDILREQTMLW